MITVTVRLTTADGLPDAACGGMMRRYTQVLIDRPLSWHWLPSVRRTRWQGPGVHGADWSVCWGRWTLSIGPWHDWQPVEGA